MDTIKQFEENGYVHLKDFLDKENCRELTNELKKLVNKGLTVNDKQCPKSEAIHGAPTFDKLLEDLLPHFENHCGKKLYPTYSYARLYKPGEELKIHSDRPACEISATLTVGLSGEQWAIFMADRGNNNEAESYNSQGENEFKNVKAKNISKVVMNVGDAVLYRGMDKLHWREKFKGEWQAQVFLHYVDANGPHAEWKYDKRQHLSFTNLNINDYFVSENLISDKFCDNIIERYSQNDIIKEGALIGNGSGTIDKSIRDVERVMLAKHAGIGSTLTATALNVNHELWKYNITHSNQTEFLIYKPDGHYNPHVDTYHSHSDETRKLTALAFLNDDFEGGKFFINPNGNIVYPPQKKGTVLVFPSYMIHGVEPVTKGIRYSCVTWLVGPYFK